MNHEAIYALYPNVVYINNDTGAFDKDGNQVSIDLDTVNAWVDPTAYKRKRAAEYPPMTDYLDGVVKGDQAQIDKYIADCLAVKAKYPKPIASTPAEPAPPTSMAAISAKSETSEIAFAPACVGGAS